MKKAIGALALVVCWGMPASAEEASFLPSMMATIAGKCTQVVVASKQAACSGVPLIVSTFQNGRIAFMIALDDQKTVLSFSGNAEAEPLRAESYKHVLDRTALQTESDRSEYSVSGDCQIDVSKNGVVSEVRCRAKSTDGKVFTLLFNGDGKPMGMEQFGPK